MIEITTDTLAGIEIIHATPAGKQQQPLPTVLFYHGFASSKMVYSYFAVALAQQGFRVVMPDAPQHGARFNGDATVRNRQFWQILLANINEFPGLHQALRERNWLLADRLALGGASMGAMTALGIMTQQPEVRCVASLMGSGYFPTLARTLFPPLALKTLAQQAEFDAILAPLARYEVSKHLPQLAAHPLLLWHGEEDDVVPATESLRLQQELQQAGLDKQLTCQWEAGVKHRITPAALDVALSFFRHYL